MPQTQLDENDLLELLYQERAGGLTAHPDVLDAYISGCERLGLDNQFYIQPLPATVEQALGQWNMPEEYQNLDLDMYFATRITRSEQVSRVAEELALFRENGLETMLKFMIYMVKVMQENSIVWGVGRGSSVSSYLLYLIGLHSVDSLKYNLDIKEFIK
jgi:DNA polymerase III alpha subunit